MNYREQYKKFHDKQEIGTLAHAATYEDWLEALIDDEHKRIEVIRSELASKSAETEKLIEAVRVMREALDNIMNSKNYELNLNNYSEEDVAELNDDYCRICNKIAETQVRISALLPAEGKDGVVGFGNTPSEAILAWKEKKNSKDGGGR